MSSSLSSLESRCIARLTNNASILCVCKALLANIRLDKTESALLADVEPADDQLVGDVVQLVRAGNDPLGDAYMHANSPDDRRASGTVYTPMETVAHMVRWAASQGEPSRVVDCGCGSGRFALAAARAFPDARIVAVDLSPFATLMCKANAVAAGVDLVVLRRDFLTARLPSSNRGPTLWLGNPPYVRHHTLGKQQKEWFAHTLSCLGVRGNGLAGLHAYFVASIAKRAARGDMGCLVLSAEWMDVGYGATVRDLFTRHLPMTYLRTYDKTQEHFLGTMSSAVVVGFSKAGTSRTVDVDGKTMRLRDFASSSRWSDVVCDRCSDVPDGFVRLGDFARVHRGVVTGNNSFWVREPGDVSERLCSPVVSHARELAGDTPACRNVEQLSRLVTLPDDLSALPEELLDEAQRIVADGLRQHVEEGFVASHRKRWWSVKPPEPPAIMMTYMARHPPVFVVNKDRLAMLNVVHGIYPTVSLSDRAVTNLTEYLNNNVALSDGRMYAGGLTKFEPREVERLIVPSPEKLEAQL